MREDMKKAIFAILVLAILSFVLAMVTLAIVSAAGANWKVMVGPAALFALAPILLVIVVVIPRRMRMERRAKALLAQMPQHEQKTVYLAFASGWYRGKGKEMEAKIIEEEKTGWTFLKASEANPFKTSLSWGGGLNLHFIRKS
jgi:cell division protein FtsW (lipid II flippase)